MELARDTWGTLKMMLIPTVCKPGAGCTGAHCVATLFLNSVLGMKSLLST